MKGLTLKKIASIAFTVSLSVFSSFSFASIPSIEDNYCSSNELVSNWNEMVEASQDYSEAMKLESVNRFFNIHMKYIEDSRNWNRDNFWATPFESMTRGQGDCEDFAIAKFKTLLVLGIPEERLTLHHVNIVNGRSTVTIPHMVVVYETEEGESLVLDNIDARILPREERSDLRTIIAFNTETLWVGHVETEHSPEDKISEWRNAISRFNNQLPLCKV